MSEISTAQYEVIQVLKVKLVASTAWRTSLHDGTVNAKATENLLRQGLVRVVQSYNSYRDVCLTDAGRMA